MEPEQQPPLASETPVGSPNGGFGEVWRLAYPVIITMASMSLMGVVDTWFMGRIGTPQQGAVGLGAVTSWTLMSFFNGTITAGNVFVAQFYGAGRLHDCSKVVWQVFYVALLASVVVLLGVVPFVQPLLGAIGSRPEIADYATRYMRIRLAGCVFVFNNFCLVGFLRGIGDTRTPMKITLAANGLNVLLTWILVFGKLGLPRLGIEGAALGTVLSQAAASASYLWVFFGAGTNGDFGSRRARAPSAALLKRILRVGLPMGLWWVLEMGGFTVFTMFVSTLGKVELAGHQIVRQMVHLSFLPGVALSVAATTLVGQYVGAGDIAAAERSARNAIRIALAIMVTMGLVFVVFRYPIARLFNGDGQVVELAARLFLFAAVFQTFDALGTVSSGAIRGAGDTRWPMAVSLVMAWFVFVPSIFLLGRVAGWGVYGAWTGATIYISTLGLMLWGRFRGGKWKKMKI